MKKEEKDKVKTNFTKLTRSGISLIVLVITIIIIIILAAAIIISLNNNNPIMEANKARYDSDVANMQVVFTNVVAKVMAKNQAVIDVTAGQINTVTSGVNETTGEVIYTLTDAQNVENSSGKIIFDKNTNTDTVFYTGKKLPIYAAGDTKWYVDEEGNISLEVAGTKYGNGNVEVSEGGTTQPKPATFGEAYAIYSDDDKSLTFMRAETEPVIGEKYNGKIITEVYKEFEDKEYISDEGVNTPWGRSIYKYDILKISFADVIKPISCQAFLADFTYCQLLDVTNLDTSEVTNMNYMFDLFGMNAEKCTIIGLDKLNTTNVTTMCFTFSNIGYYSNSITLDGIESMNVSNVQNMGSTFAYLGGNVEDFTLDLSNWDTSKVTNMNGTFYCTGENSNFNINISNWDTSNVTNMWSMFQSTNCNVIGLKDLDVGNVTTMYDMFFAFNSNHDSVSLDLSGWNVGNLNDMNGIFNCLGENSNSCYINVSNWDTASVTNMNGAFQRTGRNSTTFEIVGLDTWNVSSVNDFEDMFSYAGGNASYRLDLTSWKKYVKSSATRSNFDFGVEDKVIAPWE